MPDSVDRDAFRLLMGTFATGVTVITASDADGTPAGMTASAVSAVSLEPPVLLVCVDHGADFHAPMAAATVFAVNVLAQSQEAVSNRFATKGANKFEGVAYTTHETGAPVLDGSLASIVCATWQSFEAGDHTIFLGRVIGGAITDEAPLLHFQGEVSIASVTGLVLSPLGQEALDTPECAPHLARATLADIARSNTLFGGRQAAAYGLDRLLDGCSPFDRPLTLLDVGGGSGDIARYLTARARRAGIDLRPVVLDSHRAATAMCREEGTDAVVASAGTLPLKRRGVDIVLASQFMHHFTRDSAASLVRAFHRAARLGVVVADIRRTPVAAAGIWAAAMLLRFHATTRRDGVLSVRRGYSSEELAAVLRQAGIRAPVSRRPGFRLVAAWRTDRAHG